MGELNMKCTNCGGQLHLIIELIDLPREALPGAVRPRDLQYNDERECICASCRQKAIPTNRRDDEKHDEARRFREELDFPSAIGSYTDIINETSIDAEAYWFRALSRQGIAGGHAEDDPLIFFSAPTEHYLKDDEDVQSAYEVVVDPYQKEQMQKDVQMLDKIRDDYLDVKNKKPYQVYLCGDLDSMDSSLADTVDSIFDMLNKEKIVYTSVGRNPAENCYARNTAKIMIACGMLSQVDKTERKFFEKRATENNECRVICVATEFGKTAAGVALHDIWENADDPACVQNVMERIREIYPKQQVIVQGGDTIIINDDHTKEAIKHAYDCFMQKDFKNAKASAEKALQNGSTDVPCAFIKAYYHSYVENTSNRNAMELFFKQSYPRLNDEDLLKMKNLFLISMYQIMPFEERALRLLVNSNKGYEGMGAFVDSFSANLIPKQTGISFLTPGLLSLYKDLAKANTLPKTCLALMKAINTNSDSPIPNNTFYLTDSVRAFYDRYFVPIGGVINAMKDDATRTKYVAVYENELRKYKNKMF
ncbi:MAG: hypothetical protein E7645_04010 [Ruminococcaceae bacterium]|nr:hypothetical protein [Oscillospiraceae bacterium]